VHGSGISAAVQSTTIAGCSGPRGPRQRTGGSGTSPWWWPRRSSRAGPAGAARPRPGRHRASPSRNTRSPGGPSPHAGRCRCGSVRPRSGPRRCRSRGQDRPRASAQWAASRWLCCGWNPWVYAWLTTSSAITRACHASASRSRPSLPPAASYTLCMPPHCHAARACRHQEAGVPVARLATAARTCRRSEAARADAQLMMLAGRAVCGTRCWSSACVQAGPAMEPVRTSQNSYWTAARWAAIGRMNWLTIAR
jgi:hypothetical protein